MDLLEVKGTDFLRDTSNKALLNNNYTELEQYKIKRKLFKKQESEIGDIKEEISELKDDISLIKNLLLKTLEGKEKL